MSSEESTSDNLIPGVRPPGGEGSSAKPSGLEALGKVVALFAVTAYVVGFLTVNVYLYRLGVSEFSLFRPRFVYTGILVLFSITMSFLAPVYAVRIVRWRPPDPGGEVPKTRLEAWALRVYQYMQEFVRFGAWISLVVFILLPWGAFRFALSLRGSYPSSSPSFKALELYFTSFTVGAAAVAIALLIGKSLAASEDKKRKSEANGPGTWSLSFAVSLFFLGYLGWYLSLYTSLVYPLVPEQLGGGEPKQVQFLFARGEIEGAKQLGIPIQKQSQLSEPLSLLFEGGQFYVLRLPEGHVVEIDKKIVTAVRILK